MKKVSVLLILLLFASVSLAQVKWPISSQNVTNPSRLRRLLQNRFDLLEADVETVLAGKGHGDVFYVDSGRSNATTIDGKSWIKAEPTLEAVFAGGELDANENDWIFVAPGHAENISTANGADMDVAGVTVWCLGNGDDQAEFTYTAAAGEIVFGAANITLCNARLVAGTDSITMGVSVEAAGDYATLYNCTFTHPTPVTRDFTKMVDLASGADGFVAFSNEFLDAGSTTSSTSHGIFMGNGVNLDTSIVANHFEGYFSVAPIWSDQVDLRTQIEGNTVINMTTAQHAIEFTAAATGFYKDNRCYGDTMGSILDPGSMYDLGGNMGALTTNGVAYRLPVTGPRDLGDRRLSIGNWVSTDGMSAASYTIYTVTGDVWGTIFGVCDTSVTEDGSALAQLSLGIDTLPQVFIGDTDAGSLTANRIWIDATPTAVAELVNPYSYNAIITNGADIKFRVHSGTLTAGDIDFYFYWTPLSLDGAVTAN